LWLGLHYFCIGEVYQQKKHLIMQTLFHGKFFNPSEI